MSNTRLTNYSIFRKRIIRKYGLKEDFFDDNNDGYIDPIDNEEVNTVETNFLKKIFISWKTKLVTALIMCGFIAMTVVGLINSPKVTKETRSFFEPSVTNVYDYTINNGQSYLVVDPFMPSPYLPLGNYHSLEKKSTPVEDQFFYSSINFYDNEEFLAYSFVRGAIYISNPIFPDKGGSLVYLETRFSEALPRTHVVFYDIDDLGVLSESPSATISVDHGEYRFNYNLVTALNFKGEMVKVEPSSFDYYVYTSVFETYFLDYYYAISGCFDTYKGPLGVTFDEYRVSLNKGIDNIFGFYINTKLF